MSLLILTVPLNCVFGSSMTRSNEAPSASIGADGSGSVLTPDRPSLALSTQVRISKSEALLPEHDPSQMGALIEGMKTWQSLWKEVSDKAKHYKTVVT